MFHRFGQLHMALDFVVPDARASAARRTLLARRSWLGRMGPGWGSAGRLAVWRRNGGSGFETARCADYRSTGQYGVYLAEYLLGLGYTVHSIKRRSSSFNTARIDRLYEHPHASNVPFLLHDVDMTDSTNLIRLMQQIRPSEIYNPAAQSHAASASKGRNRPPMATPSACCGSRSDPDSPHGEGNKVLSGLHPGYGNVDGSFN